MPERPQPTAEFVAGYLVDAAVQRMSVHSVMAVLRQYLDQGLHHCHLRKALHMAGERLPQHEHLESYRRAVEAIG